MKDRNHLIKYLLLNIAGGSPASSLEIIIGKHCILHIHIKIVYLSDRCINLSLSREVPILNVLSNMRLVFYSISYYGSTRLRESVMYNFVKSSRFLCINSS